MTAQEANQLASAEIIDHLNGTLLMDRMGPAEKIASKKKLKELEEKWAETHPVKKK